MGNPKNFNWPTASAKLAVTVDEKDERIKGTRHASQAAARDLPVSVKRQARSLIAYKNREHTEDCQDANDDTSILKGKCICLGHKAKVWRVRITVSTNQPVTADAIRQFVTCGELRQFVTCGELGAVNVSRIREVA